MIYETRNTWHYNHGWDESCYYLINVEEDTWKDDAMIYIHLNRQINANLFVYQGSDRRNLTLTAEDDSSAVMGAPVRISAHNKAVVIL